MIAMEIAGIKVELPANTPLLLLREQAGGRRLLPIYIGHPEATAIAYALEGEKPQRPLTHDLFRSTLDALGAQLERVVITELRDHTFFAELVLSQAGEIATVSSRPSDAIALAVRTGSPIFASDEVLAEAGQQAPEAPPEEEEQAEVLVDEFRQFLADIDPEDFK